MMNEVIILIILIILIFLYSKYWSYKEGWGKVGKSMKKGFKKVGKVVKSGVDEAAKRAKEAARRAAEEARRAAEAAEKALRELEKWANKLFKEMKKVPPEIKKGFKGLGKLEKDVTDGFKKLKSIEKYPKEFIKDIENGAIKVYKQVDDGIMGAVNELKNFFTDEIMNVFKEIETQLVRLGEMISNFFTWILNKLTDLIREYVIDPVRDFFEDTFIKGFKDTVDFMKSIFNLVKEFFRKVISFIFNVPMCSMIWVNDLVTLEIKKMLPGWLLNIIKFINNYILMPLLGLLLNILKLFGISIETDKISKLRKICYPRLPIFNELKMLIDDIVDFFQNLFTDKKKK